MNLTNLHCAIYPSSNDYPHRGGNCYHQRLYIVINFFSKILHQSLPNFTLGIEAFTFLYIYIKCHVRYSSKFKSENYSRLRYTVQHIPGRAGFNFFLTLP